MDFEGQPWSIQNKRLWYKNLPDNFTNPSFYMATEMNFPKCLNLELS